MSKVKQLIKRERERIVAPPGESVPPQLVKYLNMPDEGTTPPLLHAIRGGHVGMCKLLLLHGADPYRSNELGHPPLFYAVLEKRFKIVKLFLDSTVIYADASLLAGHDKQGVNIFHLSAACGDIKILKLLMDFAKEHGGDLTNLLNFKTKSGLTPLHFAALSGSVPVLKELLSLCRVSSDAMGRLPLHLALIAQKPSVPAIKLLLDDTSETYLNAQDAHGRVPLHYAAAGGSLAVVNLLLQRRDLDPSISDQTKRSIVHFAAQNKNVLLLKTLIGNKYDNAQRKQALQGHDAFGWTPVHYAAYNGCVDALKFLLAQPECVGYDELCDTNEQTPLILAAAGGHTSVVKFLIAQSGQSQLNVTNALGCTALHVAADRGHTDVVMVLTKAGADVHKQSNAGMTPLFLACNSGKVATFRALRAAGALPDCTTKQERTLLHAAAFSGVLELVEAVISAGVSDVHKACKSGKRALHEAVSGPNRTLEVVKYLLALGADCSMSDSYRMTAIHILACDDVPELQTPKQRLLAFTIAQSLLDHNNPGLIKKLNEPDFRGKLPVDYAANKGDLEMEQLLREYGGVGVEDGSGADRKTDRKRRHKSRRPKDDGGGKGGRRRKEGEDRSRRDKRHGHRKHRSRKDE